MAKRRTNGKKAKPRPRKVVRPSYKALYQTLRDELTRVSLEGERLQGELETAKKGKPFFWRTRDSRVVAPSDMEESHLRNTISFLQRRLVCVFGTATYVDEAAGSIEALHEMLKEAKARGIRV